jgi:hypothetical protein
MKVQEAVEHMTVAYLRRIIDSFTKDFPRPEEERAREIVVQNADELTDPNRIRQKLSVADRPYSTRILQQNVLEALLNEPERMATEEAIVDAVTALEEEILAEAADPKRLQYEDEAALETLRSVLEVAVEDDEVSSDELSLIHRLRRKLGIQERSKQILLAQLGHFPRGGNETHSPSELADALTDLQRMGVVFYCNRLDGGVFLIPEEIVPGVKRALDVELSEKPWRLLLENLTTRHLSTILRAFGLPGGGLKEERIARVMHAGIQPSEALDSLNSSELYDILDGLAGATVSGTKDERIQRVIAYFVNLVIKEVPDEASDAETYYEYLVELAHRDRESLLANEVISKDRVMDSAFEEGTRFLFEERLGLKLLGMSGSDHPDGALEFNSGDLLMWDTKSKEDFYRFPKSHVRQFKRYIRDSGRRVSAFLVIVPQVEKGVEVRAELLKAESGHDSDVALITAEELKWLAEEWRQLSSASEFDLEVFNTTGVLTRGRLEQRLGLFL